MIRNWDGDQIASPILPKQFVNSLVVAEVIALERADDLCLEIGLNNVIFKGDTLSIIKAIKEKEEGCLWYDQMIEVIRVFFKERDCWKLQFV